MSSWTLPVGACWIQSFVVTKSSSRGDAAGFDGRADGLFVAVGGGRVEVPVAGGEGGFDGGLGFFVGDLEDAEAEDRHLDAVVERYVFHGFFLNDMLFWGGLLGSPARALPNQGNRLIKKTSHFLRAGVPVVRCTGSSC